jgi:cobyrinic acid a,c-diamide synthase
LELIRKQPGKPVFPGVVISALRGGSGKTIFSVGIIAALRQLGQTIAPFKKGPDYIDAGWLAMAAGQPCYNLDTFLIDKDTILRSFYCYTQSADMAVIEGNRGLYDSMDRDGSTSTAELAKLLHLPVILCIDGTKTTRTMAAVVSGCMQFDPAVNIQGVVLNRVAGQRHQNNLKSCIEYYCNIPVLGAVPRLKKQIFPERHMGLVPTPEHAWAKESIDAIAAVISKYLDLDAILKIARGGSNGLSPAAFDDAPAIEMIRETGALREKRGYPEAVCVQRFEVGALVPKIGIIRDSAFQFYYPENIEALKAAGAELVYTSPLNETIPPPMDALYIGGGFPETHAEALSENASYRNCLKTLAENGFPIYAECGGLMYLGNSLVVAERTYSMVGVFPLVFELHKKPQGHGYTINTVVGENPFFDVGAEIKGHEFHYSRAAQYHGELDRLVFQVKRGAGLKDGKDGICFKNTFATYTHIHALGTPSWAKAMVDAAVSYRQSIGNGSAF